MPFAGKYSVSILGHIALMKTDSTLPNLNALFGQNQTIQPDNAHVVDGVEDPFRLIWGALETPLANADEVVAPRSDVSTNPHEDEEEEIVAIELGTEASEPSELTAIEAPRSIQESAPTQRTTTRDFGVFDPEAAPAVSTTPVTIGTPPTDDVSIEVRETTAPPAPSSGALPVRLLSDPPVTEWQRPDVTGDRTAIRTDAPIGGGHNASASLVAPKQLQQFIGGSEPTASSPEVNYTASPIDQPQRSRPTLSSAFPGPPQTLITSVGETGLVTSAASFNAGINVDPDPYLHAQHGLPLQPNPNHATALHTGHQITAHPHMSPANVSSQIVAELTPLNPGLSEISLSPEELGKVRLTVSSRESGIAVVIMAERPETTDLLRRNSDALMREFEEMGASSVELSFGEHGQGFDRQPEHSGADTVAFERHATVQPELGSSPMPTIPTTDHLDLRL